MKSISRFLIVFFSLLYLLNFITHVNAGGKVVISFPEEPLGLPLKSEVRHVGISSDTQIEILESRDAKYSITLIFSNYRGYGPEVKEVVTKFDENGSVISNETGYTRMDVGCEDMPPFTYRLALHENFKNLEISYYGDVEFISPPELDSNSLELHLKPLNVTCGSSFNINIEYDIPDYLRFDEESSSLILFAHHGINQTSEIPLKY
ncbi:MAG: hypothetical protein U9M95_00255 [Candidatus Altiarchaeota archaeon]|nr:hypothetical protein [Candidatus Altiarchaeota archaeon]